MNTFTMFRDIGVQLSGITSTWSYAVAFVNGAGANNTEQLNPKDVRGRVGLNLTEEIQFGFSDIWETTSPTRLLTIPTLVNELDLMLITQVHHYLFKGEYQWRWDDQPSNNQLKLNGGYILTGYRFLDNLETIARFEFFDPGTSLENDQLTVFTSGSSYYFSLNTRLSVNHDFIR